MGNYFLESVQCGVTELLLSKVVLLALGVGVHDNPNLLNRVHVGVICGSWDQLDAAF